MMERLSSRQFAKKTPKPIKGDPPKPKPPNPPDQGH